jgi:hypothetical protein
MAVTPTIRDRVAYVQPAGHGPVVYRTLTVMQAVCLGPDCGYRGPLRDNIRSAYLDALHHAAVVGARITCWQCGRDPLVETWAQRGERMGNYWCAACDEESTGIPERLTLECVACGGRAEVTHPDGHGDQVGYCGTCEP